jgi:hypothetical protein
MCLNECLCLRRFMWPRNRLTFYRLFELRAVWKAESPEGAVKDALAAHKTARIRREHPPKPQIDCVGVDKSAAFNFLI